MQHESRRTERWRQLSRALRSESEPMLLGRVGAPSTPAEVLDRIELPAEARERISQLISPGSSLIVSDYGHNREMRENGTSDFIVLTRDAVHIRCAECFTAIAGSMAMG
jgi:hypothetical protein